LRSAFLEIVKEFKEYTEEERKKVSLVPKSKFVPEFYRIVLLAT
jgi:hypothetical protein